MIYWRFRKRQDTSHGNSARQMHKGQKKGTDESAMKAKTQRLQNSTYAAMLLIQ